ncbi:MAG: presqualene diphosphate synthase HpnD [Verrucomicrobia bacterium]|nr:presqualene diphosphate synthase HpnD [Verrucomicrobiota bacterium]MCF7707661.1 presqualene diphosphate synthase HpnD [Verrucomicrobiota bacterium]
MNLDTSKGVTRRSASNLALAFIVLPREKRCAMTALYAFCREVDDIADEEGPEEAERRDRLAEWREDVSRIFSGAEPGIRINKELQPFVRKYNLPFELFDELLKGVEMDLGKKRYNSRKELDLYCYRVASVVGLLSIEIFGYENPRCKDYAVALGRALQLTNILRDIRDDAQRDRIYLSLDDMKAFGVTEEDILQSVYSERFSALARSVADRAAGFYTAAGDLLPPEERRSMIAAELMGAVYWRLLRKMRSTGFRVFDNRRVRLTKPRKLAIIIGTWLHVRLNAGTRLYGEDA